MSNGAGPPKLDPASLYSEQEKRDALRLKTYNNILEQVHTKIRIIAKQPNNDKSLLFVVPEFVLGVPRFNTRDCVVYLAWNLRNNKFDVQYYHPNLLFISWRKHEQQYKDERSPIVQTMRNAIVPSNEQQQNNEPAKPALKKTTHMYQAPLPSQDQVKKVTFI
jgi:hypothetical protein